VQGAGKPDNHRCNRDDADSVGSKPVQPSDQDWRFRGVQQDEASRPTDPRNRGSYRGCQKQAQHTTRAVEAEPRTKMIFDQPRYDCGFPGIAQGEENSCTEVPIAHEIGGNSCGHHPERYWQLSTAAKRDQ